MARDIKASARASRLRFANLDGLALLNQFGIEAEFAQLPQQLRAAFAQLAGVEAETLVAADKGLLLLLVAALDRVGFKNRATSPLQRVLQAILFWKVGVPPQAFDVLAR